MDTIYQIVVFKAFYPYEALIIALVLAFVPYLLIRGVISRIARWYRAYAQNFANTTGKH
jgi:inner membrane protein involved in colicin E2 resistance